MKDQKTNFSCDLMIIGTGMAGMAAALFAAGKDIHTAQAGRAGQLIFASGLIDLLGVYPTEDGHIVENPWEAISRLSRDEPGHPYCRLKTDEIGAAIKYVLEFLGDTGYPHTFEPGKNILMPTPAGTIKPTYALPHTMAHGAGAMARKEPCVLLSFNGLKGFSSRQISSSLAELWPGLRPVKIDFPDARGELHTEHMARSLELRQNREKLIKLISPHLGNAESVAIPAVLGISRTLEVTEDLGLGLGVPVFEIPTMLPGVTGLRLREKFEQYLPEKGIHPFFQHTIKKAYHKPESGWIFELQNSTFSCLVSARAAVLCSGRFMGGGLHADRDGIREAIFGLPVAQPPDRTSWHHRELLHPEGHPVKRAGLNIDGQFRPVDKKGRVVYPDLFAAGSILSGHDWMRQKCGSGLAIATAYGAVNACRNFLKM
ncbi:MAG: glycerol-3-phosphate dehydrogenase subunit GlpB [Desulfobacterales bacterium]